MISLGISGVEKRNKTWHLFLQQKLWLIPSQILGCKMVTTDCVGLRLMSYHNAVSFTWRPEQALRLRRTTDCTSPGSKLVETDSHLSQPQGLELWITMERRENLLTEQIFIMRERYETRISWKRNHAVGTRLLYI